MSKHTFPTVGTILLPKNFDEIQKLVSKIVEGLFQNIIRAGEVHDMLSCGRKHFFHLFDDRLFLIIIAECEGENGIGRQQCWAIFDLECRYQIDPNSKECTFIFTPTPVAKKRCYIATTGMIADNSDVWAVKLGNLFEKSFTGDQSVRIPCFSFTDGSPCAASFVAKMKTLDLPLVIF